MTLNAASRTITSAEVRSWFGNSAKARLRKAQYRKIAVTLTHWRWPSDSIARPDANRPPDDPDRYWDFKGGIDAAKTLLTCTPAMLAHWSGLRWSPETRGGYDAIKTLEDALVEAMDYIEWPFGRYERRRGRKHPKAWHIPAVLIAKVVVNAMIEAGHNDPGLTHNSVVVRVVHKALIRMKYPDLQMISDGAIAAYLTRWDKKSGLIPK